ncbi:MAG: PspC domain-containing protein [Woeseiaceae bacterium]|nr:PspC domain-containing protein [Woeseiaceae bacterium]
MTSTTSSYDRRFVRSADRAVLGGVCAGLADYFGFNLKVTRILAVIGFLMNPPFATLAYIAIVLLIPARPTIPPEPSVDAAFRQSLRSSPAKTMSDVKRRFQSLDRRLARLEKYVTSSRYELDREFRDLQD